MGILIPCVALECAGYGGGGLEGKSVEGFKEIEGSFNTGLICADSDVGKVEET